MKEGGESGMSMRLSTLIQNIPTLMKESEAMNEANEMEENSARTEGRDSQL